MTPCEKLGYKVGDKFVVVGGGTFPAGSVVTLYVDDSSNCPLFSGEGSGFHLGPDCTPGAYTDLVNIVPYVQKPEDEE